MGMGRKKRIIKAGATYHVWSVIDHNADRLKPGKTKKLFLEFVGKAKEKYAFSLLNFSVLDNTIHLIIKPDDGVSLSILMQWLKTNFAKAWNKRHNTSGHLWGERFQSRIIESEEELRRVSAFIDEKPVEDRLVKRAEKWKWGGLWHRARGIAGIVDAFQDGRGLFEGAGWLGRGDG
jgi:REP element-mobilizing transposase RayT